MNRLQNILAEFQNLVFNSDEKPSSYEAANLYKHALEQLLDLDPLSNEESEYKEKCISTMKQIGSILGVSEEGVVTYPRIEECCDEIYEIESFGEDLDECIADLHKILNVLNEIENKELIATYGVVPHYMGVKLNCMRDHINRLIIQFNEEKSNS